MATIGSQALDGGALGEGRDEEELEELEKLEADVDEMAQKILRYRKTLPNQLKDTFVTVLAAQRPTLPSLASGSEPGPSESNTYSGADAKLSKQALPAEDDKRVMETIQSVKQKISNNISAMPVVLKRMKECISRVDKLESYNVNVHPACKRMRTSL